MQGSGLLKLLLVESITSTSRSFSRCRAEFPMTFPCRCNGFRWLLSQDEASLSIKHVPKLLELVQDDAGKVFLCISVLHSSHGTPMLEVSGPLQLDRAQELAPDLGVRAELSTSGNCGCGPAAQLLALAHGARTGYSPEGDRRRRGKGTRLPCIILFPAQAAVYNLFGQHLVQNAVEG